MPHADPEARREYMRKYKEEWKAKNPGYWKNWTKRSAERTRDLQRRWRENNPKKEMFLQAGYRARRDGVPFTITFEEIVWPETCPVFGEVLDYDKSYKGTRKLRTSMATLDRWDNTKGYVPGNVFVVSHRANKLKADMTVADAQALLSYMMKGPA